MPDTEIETKASFEDIRYAQLWEDADVLLAAVGDSPNRTLFSICSAGDNALAMLCLDPKKIVAMDLSAAQIECLRIRMHAYDRLSHSQFLKLMGSRPSTHRDALFDDVIADMPAASRSFWEGKRNQVVQHGLGGIGKFESYFRLFRNYVLPLTHGQDTIRSLLKPRTIDDRRIFMRQRWDNWRWRILMSVFFSRTLMGKLGRDPAFFDHAQGSVAEHVRSRMDHACIQLDPSCNPYLWWILTGSHGHSLPFPWRSENFETIRSRLDRIEIRQGAIESCLPNHPEIDGFNLSDIFEYMSHDAFHTLYGRLLAASKPNARLVYWNMMVPRRGASHFAASARTLRDTEEAGKAADKAFFYSDFVVEEYVP